MKFKDDWNQTWKVIEPFVKNGSIIGIWLDDVMLRMVTEILKNILYKNIIGIVLKIR